MKIFCNSLNNRNKFCFENRSDHRQYEIRFIEILNVSGGEN